MTAITSRGKRLAERLRESLRLVQRGPLPRENNRPVLWGITHYGVFVDGMTMDAFVAQASRILCDSGRVYRWQDTLVCEVREPNEHLLVLATDSKTDPAAPAVLANFMAVGVRGEEHVTQSLVPDKLVKALLANRELWQGLPQIRHYARRPIFDDQFNLCGPGWSAGRGILVHGPDIVPTVEGPAYAADASALDRLGPFTRRLFAEFCWAGDADLTNAVGVLLTGFLGNHFIDDPKPVVIIDGNQRGLGKTLFCQALGRILDGVEPRRLPLVRDDELEKKLSAILKESQSSLLFFDNVRARIESALLEANALSPILSFRILGQSGNISRPNTFLWIITSNQTSGTEDLISRGLPICLRYEGNPRERVFRENLLDYVKQYRLQILGELAGMVLRWKQAGMPLGQQKHRCTKWAQVIGGILQVAGLDKFLANLEEAEATMDEGLLALSALAEHVVGKGLRSYYVAAGDAAGTSGVLPKEWTPVFLEAEVFKDRLAEKSGKGRDTLIGTFLATKTDRKVQIQTMSGAAGAILRKVVRGNGQKRYYFEIVPEPTAGPLAGGTATAETAIGDAGVGTRRPTAVSPSVDGSPAGVAARPLQPTTELPHGGESGGNELEWDEQTLQT